VTNEEIKINIQYDHLNIDDLKERISAIRISPDFQDRARPYDKIFAVHPNPDIDLEKLNNSQVDALRRRVESCGYGFFDVERLVQNLEDKSLRAVRFAEIQRLLRETSARPSQVEVLGNQNCINNARSLHLQCAVNPTGNCQECPEFQARL
jgi:hypothetical protein